MKILAIGRNYVDHIQELNNQRPDKPVIFFKPETALIKDNAPFYYPSFSQNIHHEVEIVVRICKEGKNIEEKYASRYFEEIGIGIDFTARDLQDEAKKKGLPWALAKGFNGSAPVSAFFPKDHFGEINDLPFGLEVNGEIKQKGNTHLMLFNIDYIIAYLSIFITLKKGDIIFTGTPKGVGPVKIGDHLTAFIGDDKLLTCEIK